MSRLIRELEGEIRQAALGELAEGDEREAFRSGDRIRVHERITEGMEEGKERIQVFEGIVLQIRGRELSKSFTVRKESFGIGVEKIFPLYSPKIAKIELVERGRVRQARPYYLRRHRLR